MIIYGLCVCVGGIAIGLGLGGILNATSYYKGYEDGSAEAYEAFREEYEKTRREYHEILSDSIRDALDC